MNKFKAWLGCRLFGHEVVWPDSIAEVAEPIDVDKLLNNRELRCAGCNKAIKEHWQVFDGGLNETYCNIRNATKAKYRLAVGACQCCGEKGGCDKNCTPF